MIRRLREERGWTRLELASRLGVTPVTIYNWERGRTEPRVSQFRQLARLFGVSMDDIALVGDEPQGDGSSPAVGMPKGSGAPERARRGDGSALATLREDTEDA